MDETLIWNGNWAWALPLIFLTVVLHVTVLGVINTRVVRALRGLQDSRNFLNLFVMVRCGDDARDRAARAGGRNRAGAYPRLGALPNVPRGDAVLLSAITTYGHAELYLAPHWRLMGTLEALNGCCCSG